MAKFIFQNIHFNLTIVVTVTHKLYIFAQLSIY